VLEARLGAAQLPALKKLNGAAVTVLED